jgi:hypothetical protein
LLLALLMAGAVSAQARIGNAGPDSGLGGNSGPSWPFN